MVMRELESAPVEEPGQRYTGRYLESTPILAFEEYYFDNAEWAGELFARPDICGRLRRSPFLDVQGVVAEARIGADTGWGGGAPAPPPARPISGRGRASSAPSA
jgi:hypothetical protein